MQTHYRKDPMNHAINQPQLSHVNGGGKKPKLGVEDDGYFKNILPGYRFRPSEKELIIEYLLKKINNELLPPNRINNVKLYDFSPDDLIEKYKACGKNEWYFFTPREKKYKNGKRPDRAAGDGYWKATGADRPIIHNGEKIGFQKSLGFFRGKPSCGIKTHWLMHEFRVINAPAVAQTTQENSMRVYKKTTHSGNRKTNKEGNDSTAHSCRQLGLPLHPCIEGHDPLYVEREEFPGLFVERFQPILGESSSSGGTALLSFPYHPQGPGFASELANGRCNFSNRFQGLDQLYVECKELSKPRVEASYPISGTSFSSGSGVKGLDQLYIECQELSKPRVEASYPISGTSFSSGGGVGLISYPYHQVQGTYFASEPNNGRTVYRSNLQTIQQTRRHAVNNASESDGYTYFTS